MSTRTENVAPASMQAALAINASTVALATAQQVALLALCDTLDAAVAGSAASADAPLLAAALAVRTACAGEAAVYANVGKDLTNPRLT